MGGPTFKVLNLAIHLPPLSSIPSSLLLLWPDPLMSSSLTTLAFLPPFPAVQQDSFCPKQPTQALSSWLPFAQGRYMWCFGNTSSHGCFLSSAKTITSAFFSTPHQLIFTIFLFPLADHGFGMVETTLILLSSPSSMVVSLSLRLSSSARFCL